MIVQDVNEVVKPTMTKNTYIWNHFLKSLSLALAGSLNQSTATADFKSGSPLRDLK